MAKDTMKKDGDIMGNHVVCECTPLADRLFYCAPVRLLTGELEAIYIGPSGAYAVSHNGLTPASVFLFLRDYLGTTRVEVYDSEKGRYGASGEDLTCHFSPHELDAAIFQHVLQGPVIWNDEKLDRILKKIRILDGQNRGIYRDEENSWYITRGGNFYPCSEYDPDRVFRLALLGGVFGLHRFAVGKWFTGLIYLFTGGLIGCGWVLDVMQLLGGKMKDCKKKFLPKPRPLRPAWYICGFICGVVLFCVYGFSMGLLTGTFDHLMERGHMKADMDQATWLVILIKSLSGSL